METEIFQKYYNQLNPQQKEAVDTIEGPVMTIAGAGTGKTQILAVRIAKILLETQIDPYNILCLTFTDAGVTAMRNRLIEIIGPEAYHVKVCTFHSFCNEIIKDNPDIFIFKQEAEQLDDLERVELFQKIIDELGVMSPIRPPGDPYTYLKDLSSQIQNIKKENIDPDTLSSRLEELEILLPLLQAALKELLEAKRTFPQNICDIASPENLAGSIKTLSPSEFQKHYLNYIRKLHEDYTNSLTGEKRPDNSAGKKLRDALQKLVTDGISQLPKQKELARAYKLYQQKLKDTGRYDYEDMIMMVVRALTKNETLLRKYQELYQYILVDEYQDTNSSQNQTVDLLGNFFDAPNIFVVGDDDQSIYRFQGASIENIIDFYRNYQKAPLKLVTLINNYRSQQTVLDASGAVIEKNKTRIASEIPGIDKNLKSQTSLPPHKIKILPYQTEQSEIYGTAKQIQKLIEAGTDPAEIAVLYHKHAEATELTELFIKLEIPFELKAGQDILQDMQVSKLIKLFKLIENPNDDEVFAQTLFLDFLEFDKLDVLKFANFYNRKGLGRQSYSYLTALSNDEILNNCRLQQTDKFKAFTRQIIEWKEQASNITMPEFFTKVVKESGFLKFQINQKDKLEILNRLKALYNEIKKQTRRNHALTITHFLEQLNTRKQHDLKLVEEPLHTGRKAVQLMTAHGAKGLEFEYVFMIHATSRSWDKAGRFDKIKLPPGLIKSLITDTKQELEEDNRRLFYVAMTRAKKDLRISFAKTRFDNGKGKEDIPTLYLNEIPKDHTEEKSTEEYDKNLPEYLDTIFMSTPAPDITTKETEYFRYLAEQVVLSPTALNNYLTCPRKFFYQNLIRLPQAKSPSAAMGTAIHKALELFLNQYRKKKINPGKEFLLLQYQRALQKELLSDKDYKERLDYGRNVIGDYFDEKGDLLASNIFSEINFSSHGVNIDGIPITGKIDKLAPDTTEKGLIVSDFKTGNADRGMGHAKHGQDYWRQMVFYKILCDNSPKFARDFPNKHVTTSQIEFLEKSRRTGEYQTSAIQVTHDAIEEVIANIRMAHGEIQKLEFDKIDRGEPCDRCPFKKLCWEE